MPSAVERYSISPGQHLRAEIDRLGLDQIRVATELGCSRQTINNIVNDRQPISRAMAERLGRLTGRTTGYWLQDQFQISAPTEAEIVAADDRRAAISDDVPSGGALLVDHQIVDLIRGNVIEIDPFVARNVQPASIDLTLDDYIITSDGQQLDISGGQVFTLRGGQTANVRTRECVTFPATHAGRVGPMTSLAKFGIIASHGLQVDPGFSGHLQFCLFNAGGAPYELRSGDPIISLEIVPLAGRPRALKSSSSEPPANDNRDDVRSHFRGDSPAQASERLVRDFLRRQVKTVRTPGGFAARLADFKPEIVDVSEEAASDAVIEMVLATFKTICSNPKADADLYAGYQAFFASLVDGLLLDARQARDAVQTLARPDAGQKILPLPKGSGKISLRSLSELLGERPDKVLLELVARR